MAEDRRRLPGPEHVTVIDAVRAQRHRRRSVMTLRPRFAAPDVAEINARSTNASIPSRAASSAGSITPAFATTRSSSKTTTADSFTMWVTS